MFKKRISEFPFISSKSLKSYIDGKKEIWLSPLERFSLVHPYFQKVMISRIVSFFSQQIVYVSFREGFFPSFSTT